MLFILILVVTRDAARAQGRTSLQVPVKFCVVQGAEWAVGKKAETDPRKPPAMVAGTPFANWLLYVNDIWQPRAGIFFLFKGAVDKPGVPVIADPTPDGGTIGEGVEATIAADYCTAAWTKLGVNSALTVVVARLFYAAGGLPSFGGTQPVSSQLFYGRLRGADLCAEPRRLRAIDLPSWMILSEGVIHDPPLINVYTPAQVPKCAAAMFAHELGHVLMLSHGDGIDQPPVGEPAGVPGSRLFDEYCDPNEANRFDGLPAEDPVLDPSSICPTSTLMATLGATIITCSSSASGSSASCDLNTPPLTDLQVEVARGAAALIAERTYPPGPTCSRCSGGAMSASPVPLAVALILRRRRRANR